MHQWISQPVAWLLRVDHRQKAKRLREDVEKAFTEHPEQTGETYFQHLRFTASMAARFVFVSLIMLTHGLFPFLFTRKASSEIERVYTIMKGRIPKPPAGLSIGRIFNRRQPAAEPAEPQSVGVVGGGFSGTLLIANLVKMLDGPVTIEWFDESGTIGTGVAYGTQDSCHLLNVPAGRMGAFTGDPAGFYHWLQSENGKASAAVLYPQKEIKEESFLPRVLYAAHLRHIRDELLQTAQEKNITIHIHAAQVTDARQHEAEPRRLVLCFEKEGAARETVVDSVVLATGNMPPRHFTFQPGMIRGVRHYVADVWKRDKDTIFPEKVNQLSADSDIVIIGTGLTMVDTVLTLRKYGFKGTITALSRHGWLPMPHAPAKPYPRWEWTLLPSDAPQNALGMLRRLRKEVKKAGAAGYDWRSVIDSLRPVTQTLWQRLGRKEKRKFLNRLFTLWNIHRHRMAPEIHAELRTMQQSGALKIVPGRIYYVGSDEDGLTVAYRKRGANRVETIRATLVLNCTGPEYDIAASSHQLLKNLRDRELITVGPLRMGVEITANGSAKGKAPETIFPMGTLLIGEQFECTAVPELREQAHSIAGAVANQLQQLRENANVESTLSAAWI
jgi:uncharacterized NAD(P)/FAD-binding protein YdhS